MEQTVPPELRQWIGARFGSRASFGYPLGRCSTLGVGGPAEVLVRAGNEEELFDLLSLAARSGVALTVLGRGSNVLIADEGLSGVVIRLAGDFSRIRVLEGREGSAELYAGAAAPLPGLCLFAARRGLAGLGFASGIPGSVGGAIMGNAGAHGSSMSEVMTGFFITRPEARRVFIESGAVSWCYRGFAPNPEVFGAPGRPSVITGAHFRLKPGEPEDLLAERKALIARRKATQPVTERSAGCFFKNPSPGKSAGELIDRAGFKGFSLGGARVSEKHANYFVNTGSARAADFLELIQVVTEGVQRRFGVALEPEVKILADHQA
ncbi:MAG: UDP-N-acetylmuramate dehydrogenase [Thermodesulfobacteriota bacterium]